jgi:hypothetical protein
MEYRSGMNNNLGNSYFHHLAALQGKAPNFQEMVTTGKDLPMACPWHAHVKAWTMNPHSVEMIIVRYEDLKADTTATLAKICKFIRLQRDHALLDMVARTCSFEVMQEKENKFGWDDEAWPKDKAFVCRGMSGAFGDEMSPAVLSTFMHLSEDALKLAGYLS